MDTRVAVIGIIVEESSSVERLNDILHEYGAYIVGRMGIPYRSKGISIISIAIDAPRDIKIYRGEIYRAIQEENKNAAAPVPMDLDLSAGLPKE